MWNKAFVDQKVEEILSHRYTLLVLCLVCFFGALFIPVPLFVLVAAVFSKRKGTPTWWLWACSFACAVAGWLQYEMGKHFFALLSQFSDVGWMERKFSVFNMKFGWMGFWIVLLQFVPLVAGKVLNIFSGMWGINVYFFFLVSFLASFCKFFVGVKLVHFFQRKWTKDVDWSLMILMMGWIVLCIGCLWLPSVFNISF